MLRCLVFALSCCGFMIAPTAVLAESWPQKEVTFVVPFPAGGSMDTFSRPIAMKLSEVLGVPVVVSNKSGAGGGVGISAIARAKPDGYTIGMSSVGNMVMNPHIYPDLPYHPLKDFTPIGLAGRFVNVLVVSRKVPANSVKELLALAKKNPESITYASAGNGSTNHLSGEQLKLLTESPLLHVPYRGSGPALMDVIGGNVSFMFDTLNTSMPHIKSGDLRPLAVASAERSPYLPDVPTLNEAGIQGFSKTGEDLWWAVVAPKGVPADIQKKLNEALRKALKSPDLQSQIHAQYLETLTSTPQELQDILERDYARWGQFIQEANITLQ